MQVGSVNVIPETAQNMIVSLNGVIQKPNSSYTVAGAVITFSSALVTGDVINFIQILGSVLDLGTPSDSTVTNAKTNFVSTSSAAGLQIKGDGTTDGTIQLNCSQNTHGIKIKSPPHSASASYTLTMPNNDGDANQVLTTNGSGVLSFTTPASANNTPAFQACRTTNQSISNNTFTKVAFQTQNFDITNVYDTDVYSRFTPGVAGKYYIYTQVQMGGLSADAFYISIYKNGATWLNIRNGTDTSGEYILTGAAIDTADNNDYYEVFAYQNSGGALNVIGYSDAAARIYTAFGAYRIIT